VPFITQDDALPKRVAKVLFDFEAQADGDLALAEGDCVLVTYSDDSGWWEGVGKAGEGRFPSNYVKEFTSPWFLALADYKASSESEVSLSEGDGMKVTDVDPSGWWKGYIPRSNAWGWFPAAYVEQADGEKAQQISALFVKALAQSAVEPQQQQQQQQQQQHEQQQLAQDEGDGARFSSSSTPQRMPRNQRAETMAEFGDQVDEVVARED